MLFNSGNDNDTEQFHLFYIIFDNNSLITALNLEFVTTINHGLNSFAIAFIQIVELSGFQHT